jgi:hypothetical protein
MDLIQFIQNFEAARFLAMARIKTKRFSVSFVSVFGQA